MSLDRSDPFPRVGKRVGSGMGAGPDSSESTEIVGLDVTGERSSVPLT